MDPPLPMGWARPALAELVADVVAINPGGDPEAAICYIDIGAIDSATGTVATPKIINGRDAPSRARQRIKTGDVLFSLVRPGLRAIASVPALVNPVASTGFCVLSAASGVEPRFLYHWVRNDEFLRAVVALQRGVSYPAVRALDLLRQTVPLAPSLEQAKIVERLEALLSDLDAGVAELHAAQRKLTAYRQSLLKAAVEGSLTAGWRDEPRAGDSTGPETGEQLLQRILVQRRAQWETKQLARFKQQGKAPPKDWHVKYPEPVSVRADGLSALPKGWTWATAEQLCGFITKGTTPPTGQDQGGLKTIPFLRVTNLSQDGSLDLSNQVWVSDEVHRGLLVRSIVYPGDVLMNIVGPPLGQVSVVPASFPEWNINQAIAVFRAVDGVLPAWLCLCLLSPVTLRWLRAQAKTTAGQTNLTLEVCRSLPVPLPPMAVQSAIAEAANGVLAEITGLASATSHGLRLAAAQRRNLLKCAFSGQLVPQDPADEPAPALLARIQAARAAQATAQAPKSRPRPPASRTRTSAC